MEERSYEGTWEAYRAAVESLYDQTVREMAVGGEAAGVHGLEETLADRTETVVARSRELGEVIASYLESEDTEQRELAELQLLSVASTDIAVANDLARAAEEEVSAEALVHGPELPGVLAQVLPILDVSPEDGVRVTMGTELRTEETEGSPNIPAAKQRLRDAARNAVERIQSDAAHVCGASFSRLAPTPLPKIKQAADASLSELIHRVGEGTPFLLRSAARLLVQALDKVLKVLPGSAADAVRRQAAEWIAKLRSEEGGLWETMLGELYGVEEINAAVDRMIEQARDDLSPGVFDEIGTQVAQLASKFGKQRQVMMVLVQGLEQARSWIIMLRPYGLLGLTAAYVAVIGYAGFAGGDYVDWSGPVHERLNLVPGVRSVVQNGLT